MDTSPGDGTLLGRIMRSASAVSLPLPSITFPTAFSAPALATMDEHDEARQSGTSGSFPCLKKGRLLVEVDGIQRQWEPCTVALVGTDVSNLALHYTADATEGKTSVVRLHSATIDLMEEIFSVITLEQTWYLCAESQREAEEWADTICGALEAAAGRSPSSTPLTSRRRRLSSHVTASTVKEIQTRDVWTRVDEFVEIYVRSNHHDIHRQATRGAFSWSCLRNLTWRLWLGVLPQAASFEAWVPTTQVARVRYAQLQDRYAFELPSGIDDDSEDPCFYEAVPSPKEPTLLLHMIQRDVVRTRCAMPYFREPETQAMLIRILFIYAQEHSDMGYHQGMGELLAVMVYLLYIEQFPLAAAPSSIPDCRWSFENISVIHGAPVDENGAWDDNSYVHVDVVDVARAPSILEKGQFLDSHPFLSDDSKPTTACKETIVELLQAVTCGDCIEHDAYALFAALMDRMTGVFCPTESHGCSSLHMQLERIQYDLLTRLDPALSLHLRELQVLPEVFLLKWVRLLFAREFQMYQVWALWDAILSVSSDDLSFVQYLCVAMLHEARDELLAQDDVAGVLQCLKETSVSYGKVVDTAREMHDRLLCEDAIAVATRSD
ncbi:hypothetical protein SPRG_15236 [Saprolegnia parasitica CBS 223.65]|uniref:Rab-GAP TBC domain-containing protein n=1 Tax=Saprolegnia parasitica (strain CBS 223.65) TaxID=695850 RepID=A0A067BXL0_SAPPC|nr:hypothetical protein SPRG_15236 [Saprolegnia parasitica CBS 223.65]KDO19297.1 hypothetical protein SPRG_15236 [Saprolegnia parasitica CBS 223.65]|eukprot:XP_012210008.1 hypothetical protein SPRG_15236 [Saprolegnia parasitica CBS 223.65]